MSATAARAADRREVALVAVAERPRPRGPRIRARDDARGVAALLHRDGRDPGSATAARPRRRTRTMSPIANTSGWPGGARSGSTRRRGRRGRPRRRSRRRARRRGRRRHARGPDHRSRRDALGRAARVPDGHATRRRGRSPSGRGRCHAERLERAQRPSPESDGGKLVEHPVAGLDQQDPRRRAGRSTGSRVAGCRARARRSGPPSRRRSGRRRRPRTSATPRAARRRARARRPRTRSRMRRRTVSALSSDFTSAADSRHSSWPK